jgi:hypothetical protein
MLHAMSPRIVLAAFAFAACLGACGGVSTTVAPESVVSDAGPAPRLHPADALELARHLPRDTSLFATTRDLFALADALGRVELIDALRREYEQAVHELVRELDHNLLDPATLARLGIDSHGETSLAVLGSVDNPTLVAGFGVTDVESFKTAIYRESGRPDVVNGHVVVGERDAAVVVLERSAMLVVGRHALAQARRLAALDPSETLSQHRPFRVAMRSGGSASAMRAESIRGYLDLRAVIYTAARLDPRFSGRDAAELARDIERSNRDALARARHRGASADELVAIDARFADAPNDPVGNQAAADMMRTAFGDVGAMAVGFEVADKSLKLRLALDMAEGSVFRKVLSQRRTKPAIVRSLKRAPALLLSLAIEPEPVLQALELFGQKRSALSQTAGFDVDADFAKLATGEFGLAVFAPDGDEPITLSDAWSRSSNLRALALIGTRDDKAAKKLLARLSDHPQLSGMLKPAARGGYVLRLPEVPPLHLRAVGDALAIATDAKLLNGDKSEDQPRWLRRSAPHRLLWRTSSPVVASIDLAALALAVAAQDLGRGYHIYELPAAPAHATPAYQAARKELEQANAKLRKRLQEGNSARLSTIREATSGLGHAALRMSHGTHGVELEARYQGSRSTAETVGALAATLLAREEAKRRGQPVDRELEQLYIDAQRLDAKLYELQLELDEANRKK